MLPIRSTETVQPASSHQRMKRRRASPSRSLAASRHTPPFSVAPIWASSIRLAHSRSPLIVRLRISIEPQESLQRCTGCSNGRGIKTADMSPNLVPPDSADLINHDLGRFSQPVFAAGVYIDANQREVHEIACQRQHRDRRDRPKRIILKNQDGANLSVITGDGGQDEIATTHFHSRITSAKWASSSCITRTSSLSGSFAAS